MCATGRAFCSNETNSLFSSLNVVIRGAVLSLCVRVCVSVVTDVHPVAAGKVLHILHVLSDSDGQQVVLFNISKHFNPLSLYLSLFRKPNIVDEI